MDAPVQTLIERCRATTARTPPPLLLLALCSPLPRAALVSLARGPGALLMLTGPALSLAEEEATPIAFDARALATALGVAVTSTPEELVEAAALLDAGLAPAVGRVLALATSADSAALLDDALARAGVPVLAQRATARVRVVASARAARRAAAGQASDALLLDDQLLCGDASPLELSPATLGALAALLATARDHRPPRRPRGADPRVALDLLRSAAGAIGELSAKRLLRAHGVPTSEDRLVTSASAAARAARSGPVAVKACGPTLRDRQRIGAVILPVTSASACRQAFRDVLHACSRLPDPVPLDGVLVSRLESLPFALEAALLGGELPLLVAARRDREALSATGPVVLACPAAPAVVERAAAQLLGSDASGAAARRLVDFLARLSWMAADLAAELAWLYMDTISPSTEDAPPRVIDALGLRAAPPP